MIIIIIISGINITIIIVIIIIIIIFIIIIILDCSALRILLPQSHSFLCDKTFDNLTWIQANLHTFNF